MYLITTHTGKYYTESRRDATDFAATYFFNRVKEWEAKGYTAAEFDRSYVKRGFGAFLEGSAFNTWDCRVSEGELEIMARVTRKITDGSLPEGSYDLGSAVVRIFTLNSLPKL